MTTTTYSDVTLTTLAGFVQENLRGRVSKITYDVNGDNVPEYSSFFSYDVHGNVKTLIQKDNTLGFKRMDYYYDLISGNVKDIVYQTGKPDRFYHKYYYDADNRITSVQTSHDSIIWDKDASYFYYRHGPLARTELGDKKVQGLDYAYTLQGWLKGVNSNQVSPDYDQGKDGKTGTQYNTGLAGENANVASDVFGYSLGYFDPFSGYTIQKTSPFQNISINANGTDYQSADASKTFLADISPLTQVYNYVAGSTTSYSSQAPNLYNGNIKHMVTSIWEDNGSGGGAIQPQLTAYNYDQLNRITNMHGYRDLNASTNQWNNTVSSTGTYGDAFKTSYTYDANGNIKTLNRADVDGDDFDQLDYKYDERVTAGGTTKLESNKLYTVIDPAPPLSNTPTQTIEDIKTMTAFVPYDAANPATFKNNNFYYDEIGNLIQDKSSHIANIDWNAYGKIRKITFDDESSDLAFEYDASGNRTAKIEQKKDQSTYSVLAPTEWKYTYYVHDAKGNIMSVYEKNPTLVVGGAANNLIQTQVPIYGSSRIGLFDPEVDLTATTSVSSTFARRFLKQKQYELTNHLGNVLTTISDRKLKNSGGAIAYSAEIISAQDYYPFGMIMPGRNFSSDKYRFGFNGKEMDDEVKGTGNSVDFGARVYDARLGRLIKIDPQAFSTPSWSPYKFAGNNPIVFIDKNGEFDWSPTFEQQYPKVTLVLQNFSKLMNGEKLPEDLEKALKGVNLKAIFNDKLLTAMIGNSTLTKSQLEEVYQPHCGPEVRAQDLDLRQQDPPKFVNGQNEQELNKDGDPVANHNRSSAENPGDEKGLLSIDNDVLEVLEFELGGEPDRTANAIGFGGKKTDVQGLQKAFEAFSITLNHETVHFGRNKTGIGNQGGTNAIEYGFKMEKEAYNKLVQRFRKEQIKNNSQ